MRKSFKFFTLFLLLAVGVPQLWAQTSRYVVSAELHLSMTHPLWPDVFLNGHQLVEAQDHVFDRTSQIDLSLTREQLCYFTSVNCLALEVPQTLGSTTGTNASIGLAYVLKVVYSDKSTDWITSDQGKTRRYFIQKNVQEPPGWTIAGFEDQAWPLSRIFTPKSAAVMNPETNLPAKYLPTFKDSSRIYLTLGQKMLFRRKYLREVAAPPDCGEPNRQLAPLKVEPMPRPVWTGVISPTLTFTPQPIFTPMPTATAYANSSMELAQPNLASRLLVSTQVSTATAQLVWTSTIFPTLTPVPVWTVTPSPTSTPRPKIRRKLKRKPTSTPTFLLPTNTPTQTALPFTPIFTATATVTTGTSQDSSMAATIVFNSPPVNINASFADGPGVYRLEIVNAKGAHINTLYNQQVVLEKETWVTWDGTNDDGKPMGYGNYRALLSKDGVLIEKIALTWIAPNSSQSNP